MATDLSDFQLEGAREFLKSLSLITVGTEDLDPLLKEYYDDGHQAMINRIRKLQWDFDWLRDQQDQIRDDLHNLEKLVSHLKVDVQELQEPFLHREKVTSLSPQVENEISNLIQRLINNFANEQLEIYIRMTLNKCLNNAHF